MVGGHVVLELFAVGARGGLPSRGSLDRVEVVGQVLGVGVANLPVWRETGVSLADGDGVLASSLSRLCSPA